MEKYICKVCGYIYEGDGVPTRCPICKVGADMFKLLEDVSNPDNSALLGWEDYAKFRVDKKIRENEVVTSFYLRPVEELSLPTHVAGQFITVKPIVDSDEVRLYSLSMKPGEDFYRISVKKEEQGVISKYLTDHVEVDDVIEITTPLGEFILEDSKKPLVLISGGIGVTPVMSMLYSALEKERDILFVQASLNGTAHTFKEELQVIKGQSNRLKTAVFYQDPQVTDRLGIDYDYKGFVTKEWMAENLPRDGAFYFCGPLGFMKHIYKTLKALNVEDEQIHYESFGPDVDFED